MNKTFSQWLETDIPVSVFGRIPATALRPLMAGELVAFGVDVGPIPATRSKAQVPLAESYSKYDGDYKKFEVK